MMSGNCRSRSTSCCDSQEGQALAPWPSWLPRRAVTLGVVIRVPAIRLLQLTTFVSTLDRFVMPPVLIAIAVDLHVPLSDVVQAASAYFLAYGLMQPLWGSLSDTLGLVRTMRLTLLAAALCTAAAAFVSGPVGLLLTRGLAGGFFAAAYPATLIYLGDTVPARQRQQQVTRLMVGLAVGIAIASAGAGLVAEVFSWRVAFAASALASLAVVAVLGGLQEPSPTRTRNNIRQATGQVVRSRPALFVLLLAFVEGAVLLGVLTLLPPAVQAAGASASVAGAVTGIYGLAVFGFAGAVGRLSARLHPAWLIALGATAAAVACLLLSLSRAPVVTIIVTVLLGVAWTAMHSSLQTWATEVIPDARPTMVSLFAGALFAGSATAAAMVAGPAEAGSYGMIFAVAAAVSVPLGLIGAIGRARWRGP
jgi:predicted MFS family arabinose efflux permease